MKYHRISVSLITSASVAAIWAVPGTLKTAHAQLSTGKPPAESIPPHGYVIASKPPKGTDTPADYTFVLTRDEIYLPIIVRKHKGDGRFPASTMGWEEGRKGKEKVDRLAESVSQVQERMTTRSYIVATVNY